MSTPNLPSHHDLVVIGGGALGLATAHVFLERHPDATVALLERRAGLRPFGAARGDAELTGPVFTAVGPLRRSGRDELDRFLRGHAIPTTATAHLVVAADPTQRHELRGLYERYRHDLGASWLDPEQLRVLEPTLQVHGAVRVPGTRLLDARTVSTTLAETVLPRVDARFATEVEGIAFRRNEVSIATTAGTITCDHVINAAGRNAYAVLRSTAGCPMPPVRAVHEDIVERRSLGPLDAPPRHLVSTLPAGRPTSASVFVAARADGTLEVRSRHLRPGLGGLSGVLQRHTPLPFADPYVRRISGDLGAVELREVRADRRVRTVLHDPWSTGPSIVRHGRSTHVLDLGERTLCAAFRAAVEAIDGPGVAVRRAG